MRTRTAAKKVVLPLRHRWTAADPAGKVLVIAEGDTRQSTFDRCVEDARTMVAVKRANGPLTSWTFNHEEMRS